MKCWIVDGKEMADRISRNGITVQEFAADLGVPVKRAQSWLEERFVPSTAEIEKILDVFEWPLHSYVRETRLGGAVSNEDLQELVVNMIDRLEVVRHCLSFEPGELSKKAFWGLADMIEQVQAKLSQIQNAIDTAEGWVSCLENPAELRIGKAASN